MFGYIYQTDCLRAPTLVAELIFFENECLGVLKLNNQNLFGIMKTKPRVGLVT